MEQYYPEIICCSNLKFWKLKVYEFFNQTRREDNKNLCSKGI